MKKIIRLLLVLCIVTFSSCKDEHKNLKDGLYAEIETSKGKIILQLEYNKAPITVANFVTLTEGKNSFVSEDLKGKPFYDNMVFHRVIANFMIQTGDPYGTGAGDAGYTFKDEFTNLKHDKPGVLSMANGGPNTNSCQFFITHIPTPWLDGKHSVFGHVVEGMDVVNAIVQNDAMNSIKIIRKGEAVKKFDAVKIFNDNYKSEIENKKKQASIDSKSQKEQQELAIKKQAEYKAKYGKILAAKTAYFNVLKKTALKSTSGLGYKIIQNSKGKKPSDGEQLYIRYSGFLENGTLFDTSETQVAKQFGMFDEQRAMQHGYSAIPYTYGSTEVHLIAGFIEGIQKLKIGEKAVLFIPSNLAYGEQGAGNAIPPNANIIFEIELKNK